MADAAAPMHRQSGGFVGRDQAFIFVQQRQVDFRRFWRSRLGSQPQRRYAHPVARAQAVSRVHAAAVDAHFPTSKDAINMAFGHALCRRAAGNCRCAGRLDSLSISTRFTETLLKSFILLIMFPLAQSRDKVWCAEMAPQNLDTSPVLRPRKGRNPGQCG